MVLDPELFRELLVSAEIREETEWFKQFAGNTDNALVNLEKHFIAEPVRDARLLAVSMSIRNPKDSPKIVNKLVNLYIKRVQGWAQRSFRNDVQAFENALRLNDNELNAIDSDIRELEGQGSIPAMLRGAPTITARLASLQDELARKESEMELLRARYKTYSEASPESMQASPEILARIEANAKVTETLQRVRRLKDKRDDVLISSGASDPKIVEINKIITTAEEDIAKAREGAVREERGLLLESYRTVYFSSLQAVAELRESMATATNAQLDLDKKLRRYDELIRRRDRVEGERDRLAEQHQQLLMVVRTREPARISVFRQATVPLEPRSPLPEIWIPIGIAVSRLVGIVLALIVGPRNEVASDAAQGGLQPRGVDVPDSARTGG